MTTASDAAMASNFVASSSAPTARIRGCFGIASGPSPATTSDRRAAGCFA
jgi:hypothetical protein